MLTGIILYCIASFHGSGVNILLQEWRLTNDYMRFALLLATAPFLFCVSLVSPRFCYVSIYD